MTTIKLDSIANPTHIDARLGALWVGLQSGALIPVDVPNA